MNVMILKASSFEGPFRVAEKLGVYSILDLYESSVHEEYAGAEKADVEEWKDNNSYIFCATRRKEALGPYGTKSRYV